MPLSIPEPVDRLVYQAVVNIQIQRLDPGEDGKLFPSSAVVYQGQGRGADPAEAYTLALSEANKLAGFASTLGPVIP